MNLAYADPPYFGMCGKMYEHFHNEGGAMPWDGECWDKRETHATLLDWLVSETDGWAYSCNPTDLEFVAGFGRVAAWTKTWHQIRPTTVQYAWEPVIFQCGRKDNKRAPMVRDWLSCAVARQTGQPGAKPDAFNDWILELLVYEGGDTFTDLFPGSASMSRAVERHGNKLSFESALGSKDPMLNI